MVSTHSRLKAAGGSKITLKLGYQVSTHSRLKAAGNAYRDKNSLALRFNTQPPEGGWVILLSHRLNQSCFNTQPPEGGWMRILALFDDGNGFNTQPPEGGWIVW